MKEEQKHSLQSVRVCLYVCERVVSLHVNAAVIPGLGRQPIMVCHL